MYYVYRLEFGKHEYIGCTNNIRRRKDQHNGNARKGKSKLGYYLLENGITLTTDDFQILVAFENRADALREERAIVKLSEAKGALMLNDNYSNDCTRRGKNIGNTAKDYVVVDYKSHTVARVNDLRQYCIRNNLKYKQVQRTVKPGRYSEAGIKVFYADEWEDEVDKYKYISGEFISEVKGNAIASKIEKTSKTYEVQFPDGHIETVKNLDRFAMEHGINPGNLHATFMYQRPTKGYQVLRRI